MYNCYEKQQSLSWLFLKSLLGNDNLLLNQFADGILREKTSKAYSRINNTVFAKETTWVEYSIAANLAFISHYCAKFGQSSHNSLFSCVHNDLFLV